MFLLHIGLTPQTVSKLGGFKVRGYSEESDKPVLEDALALQESGVWSIIPEAISEQFGKLTTSKVTFLTIGIGGGRT